jgi:hypothetical protein
MAEWKKIIVSGSDAHLASVTASNLTNDNILVAGTGGVVESSGITYDGSTLGIGSSVITSTGATSILTGSFTGSFTGDGSNLTGVSATGLDIDGFTAGTTLHQTQDHFLYSDNGTEKKITFSDVEDAIFGNISGDATVAAGGALTIANDAVETSMIAHSLGTLGTHQFTGSFSGSFTGTTDLPDLVSGDGLSGGPYDGSATKTFTIDLDGSTLAKGASGLKVADGQIGTTQIADSIGTLGENQFTGSFSGSFTGDGTGLTGLATNLSIAGDDGTGTVALQSQTLTINGTANEVTASVSGQTVTIGLPDDVTIGNDLTVTGDLNVQGTTVTIDTANLAVEDKFILINSGSSTATDESGIIFGGSNGSANNGAALIWNGDFNSNDGRLAIANSVNADASSATVNYHLAGVFSGTANDAATAQADHEGNIRVDSSGDIFIYVA